MKKKILILLLLVSTKMMAMGTDISALRGLMANAYKSESAAQDFYNNTKNINANSSATLLGFKAIAEMMMCKHLVNPLSKLSYFNKGKKHLEQAISMESNNPELRFMRYCTQVNAPDMLGYNTAINADKTFLIQYLKTQKNAVQKQDEALYFNVKKFLLADKHCSEAEKNLIKKL